MLSYHCIYNLILLLVFINALYLYWNKFKFKFGSSKNSTHQDGLVSKYASKTFTLCSLRNRVDTQPDVRCPTHRVFGRKGYN